MKKLDLWKLRLNGWKGEKLTTLSIGDDVKTWLTPLDLVRMTAWLESRRAELERAGVLDVLGVEIALQTQADKRNEDTP